MAQVITSTSNENIKYFMRLHTAKGRREENAYLIEGEKMLFEAVNAGKRPIRMLVEQGKTPPEGFSENEFIFASKEAIAKASEAVTPQGIVASVALDEKIEELIYPIVVLDGVQDPGNCGTIWRTCEAAGFKQIVFLNGSADPFSPKVVRSSMGAVFRIPAVKMDICELFEKLEADDCAVIAALLGGEPFYEREPIKKNIALFIGSEARGVSEITRNRATHKYMLPMAGKTESLNASVAAGIMMYDLFIKEGEGRR